jgi:hypothetical protein
MARPEAAAAMTSFFPYFKDNTCELRKWTIRKRDETIEIPSVSCIQPKKGVFEINLDGISRPRSMPLPEIYEVEDMDLCRNVSFDLPFCGVTLHSIPPKWEIPDGSDLAPDLDLEFGDNLQLAFT